MKDIWTVFRKEIKRFFTDRRTLTALFLPGIVIFVVYSILGSVLTTQIEENALPSDRAIRVSYTSNFGDGKEPILIENMTLLVQSDGRNNTVLATPIDKTEAEDCKTDVKDGKVDLLVVYSDDFETALTTAGAKNSVSLFYDASSSLSSYAYSVATSLLSTSYDNYTVNVVDDVYQEPNLGEGDFAMEQVLSFLVPMLTIALVFSSVLTICPEAIAGEKERGTLACLLLTPARRSSIAIGKILALSVTALASGLVSFLGTILSLPELFGGTVDLFSVLTPGTIAVLFFLILTALFLFVSVGLFVSAFAKTIREANSYLTPLMVVLMVLAVIPATVDLSSIGFAFVPLLDIVASMNLLLTGTASAILVPYIGVTIAMNLLLSLLFVFLVARLFDDERVMFSR